MLSSAQRAEFDRRGLLRLPATIPPADVTAMRQRLWQLTMLVVFAHLAPVRPRGGGTLVITGSHQLTTPAGPQAGNAPVRSREVKAYLRTLHPWLRDLWQADGDTGRIHRYLTAGAVIDGVPVRVEELTGEPGDAVIMHPRLLHVVAPNSLDTPRMMLLQFLHRRS